MQISILLDIVVIIALSTFVNLLFTRLNIPTVVSHLLTGIVNITAISIEPNSFASRKQ